ncbi:MAG: hypothetical protein WAR38_04465, partial [Chitinophagaceae bacterium]
GHAFLQLLLPCKKLIYVISDINTDELPLRRTLHRFIRLSSKKIPQGSLTGYLLPFSCFLIL